MRLRCWAALTHDAEITWGDGGTWGGQEDWELRTRDFGQGLGGNGQDGGWKQ